jgi:hypothetical protein
MKHRCPVDGCEARIPREQLMCYAHWRKVPGELQRAVLQLWNHGQIGGAYLQARDAAVAAVDRQLVRRPAAAPAAGGAQLSLF